MSRGQPLGEVITDEFTSDVVARAAENVRVRRALPDGGRINLDRRLPFLCVYRRSASRQDLGTEQLINSEAAILVASSSGRASRSLATLVRRLAETLSAHFGGFLILELWTTPDEALTEPVCSESGEPIPPKPAFRISTARHVAPQRTIDELARSLKRIKIFKQAAEVSLDNQGSVCPPNMKPLMLPSEAKESAVT